MPQAADQKPDRTQPSRAPGDDPQDPHKAAPLSGGPDTCDSSSSFALTLSEEERRELLSWLEQRLGNKRVEEHRTEAREFRKHVYHQEKILEALIGKLRSVP